MKKLLKVVNLILSLILIFTLSSCFWTKVNDDNIELTSKEVEFNNLSTEYEVKDSNITLYFYENGNVPYVNIEKYYAMLDGYYDVSKKTISINENFNRLYIIDNNQSLIRTIFDWRYNTVTFKNELSPYSVKSSGTIDFTSYYDLKIVKSITSLEIEYYLGNYNIDILYNKGNVLMPLSVLSMLDSSYYKVVYNGNKVYGFYYGDDLKSVYDVDLVGKEVPNDVIDETKNELFFLLNEKYGLKEVAKVDDYKSYISNDIILKLESNNPETRNDAYVSIINKLLDDPHSRMMASSFYSENKDEMNTIKYFNEDSKTIRISSLFQKLKNACNESEKKDNYIYYKGNTLFITFSNFELGKKDDVYEKIGVYKEDAYLIDTAALFYKALNDAKSNHSEVENVVIDLSFNGGGYVAAMYRALTFLSDNDIYFGYTVAKDYTEIYNVKGDPNMDGSYDNDAFNYNYYVLESEGTFSAANAFACFAKYSGVAKTIGKRSGGGMCAVIPYVLSDGTEFSLSDNSAQNAIRISHDKYYVYEIESGAPVDIPLEYEDFYNLDKIIELINN